AIGPVQYLTNRGHQERFQGLVRAKFQKSRFAGRNGVRSAGIGDLQECSASAAEKSRVEPLHRDDPAHRGETNQHLPWIIRQVFHLRRTMSTAPKSNVASEA